MRSGISRILSDGLVLNRTGCRFSYRFGLFCRNPPSLTRSDLGFSADISHLWLGIGGLIGLESMTSFVCSKWFVPCGALLVVRRAQFSRMGFKPLECLWNWFLALRNHLHHSRCDFLLLCSFICAENCKSMSACGSLLFLSISCLSWAVKPFSVAFFGNLQKLVQIAMMDGLNVIQVMLRWIGRDSDILWAWFSILAMFKEIAESEMALHRIKHHIRFCPISLLMSLLAMIR